MKKDFFINNRNTLVNGLEDNSMLILYAGQSPHRSADSYHHYTPNRNFYYVSGIHRDNAIFMLLKKADKVEATLFIERKDPMVEKWVGIKMSVDEAKAASGIENIKYIDEFTGAFAKALTLDFENLYMDLERPNWDDPSTLEQGFAKEVAVKYPGIRIRNIYHAICTQRLYKSQEELECIKHAIDVTSKGIESMMKNAKAGMYEYELEAYFDFTLTSNGIREHAFPTIAASGENGVILHYETNNRKTEQNDLILCDLGAAYGYYSADITRTFPVGGKFTDRQKTIYNIVLKALEETTKAVKPGMKLTELNDITKRVLTDGLREIGLIKEDAELTRYYYHGVSHYLGLDTHDVGDRELPFKPGVLITVEPGLYIAEENIGIRIEDNVLVTESGYENLSKGIIRTVEDIEKLMS